jgi:hypothetical protein
LGQVMLQKEVNAGSYTINLPNIEPGIYYIQFYNSKGEKIESKKLIIE